MNRVAILISLLLALTGAALTTVDFVSAVGGGGGGSGGSTTPQCTEDTWSCGSWSTCSGGGSQTRECTLTEDCPYASNSPALEQSCTPPCLSDYYQCSAWSSCDESDRQTRECVLVENCSTVEDPMPIEEQACQPSCSADEWTCSDWSVCSLHGEQSRTCTKSFDCPSLDTPSPAESQTQTCTPSCTADSFECTNWKSCDTAGNQYRSCTLSSDCPLTADPKPAEAQLCPYLQCGNLPTLRERVECRLNLTPDGIARELQIQYLPEACRALPEAEQGECIVYYLNFQPCWNLLAGPARFTCAQTALQLVGDVASLKAECAAQGGAEAEVCLEDLRDKVYALIAFRMYDLEERAEEFARQGFDLEATIEMVVAVIEHKIAFQAAESYDERRAILQDLRAEWAAFIEKVKTWRGV